MKVEMRWLERKTGKTLMNDWGYYYDETFKVLQYRQSTEVFNNTVTRWSEWTEVPTVEEDEKTD